MALKEFIKENFVLVVGLTLPLLLIVLFFFATILPKSMATPPQYEMLFTTNLYKNQNPPPYNVDFFVKDGTLNARLVKNVMPPPNTGYGMNHNWRVLMVYDGKTQNVRELPYNLSNLGDIPNGSEVVFEEFKNMKVDNSTKAPDGYTFNKPGYRSGGLTAELFWGGGYHNNNPRVSKGAASFPIPNTGDSNYNYYDLQFIGWVLKKE